MPSNHNFCCKLSWLIAVLAAICIVQTCSATVISKSLLHSMPIEEATYKFPMLLLNTSKGKRYVGSDEVNCQHKDPSGDRIKNNVDAGYIAWTFTVPGNRARIALDTLQHSPDSLSDSMHVRIDNSKTPGNWVMAPRTKEVGPAAVGWEDTCFNISGGKHTVRFYIREPGAGLSHLNVSTVADIDIVDVSSCNSSQPCAWNVVLTVDIELDNFCGNSHFNEITVDIDGTPCSDLSLENGVLRCEVPASATTPPTGVATLMVSDAYANSTALLYFVVPPPPPEELNIGLIVGCVIGGLILIALPIVWKFTENQRRMARLLNTNKVATELAESVASMDFDEIEYLHEIEEPNRIQLAFIKIVTALKTYKAYMPASLFANADEDESAADAASELSHSLSQSSATRSKTGGDSASRASARVQTRAGALNTAGALAKKNVSVVCINVANFNTYTVKIGGDTAHKAHADYIDAVLDLVKTCRGVPDTFIGDRILVNFNAAASNAQHRVCAAQFAVRVTATNGHVAAVLANLDDSCCVYAGVGSGQAFVGNMGGQTMKRYTIVGSIVNVSYVMCRLAPEYNARALGTLPFAKEVSLQTDVRYCVTPIMYTKHSSTPIAVAELRGEKKASEDEWMYQLQEGDEKDPYAVYNEAVLQVHNGVFIEAHEQLKAREPAWSKIVSADELAKLTKAVSSSSKPEPRSTFSIDVLC